MKYIECPEYYSGDETSVFLGGGITGCPLWQNTMVELLKDTSLVLLNPRRAEFDVSNASMEKEQIKWEFKSMRAAKGIIFWFPKETLCPITLYELGSWVHTNKPLFIGHDPEYKRSRDLAIQIPLVRSGQMIHTSLESVAVEVARWAKRYELGK